MLVKVDEGLSGLVVHSIEDFPEDAWDDDLNRFRAMYKFLIETNGSVEELQLLEKLFTEYRTYKWKLNIAQKLSLSKLYKEVVNKYGKTWYFSFSLNTDPRASRHILELLYACTLERIVRIEMTKTYRIDLYEGISIFIPMEFVGTPLGYGGHIINNNIVYTPETRLGVRPGYDVEIFPDMNTHIWRIWRQRGLTNKVLGVVKSILETYPIENFNPDEYIGDKARKRRLDLSDRLRSYCKDGIF